MLSTLAVFAGAAIAEIAGCFAFWAWARNGASALWLIPGVASLMAFAWLLTLTPSDYAGRAYAAYGGVYIVASLLWLMLAEGRQARPLGRAGRRHRARGRRGHPLRPAVGVAWSVGDKRPVPR